MITHVLQYLITYTEFQNSSVVDHLLNFQIVQVKITPLTFETTYRVSSKQSKQNVIYNLYNKN